MKRETKKKSKSELHTVHGGKTIANTWKWHFDPRYVCVASKLQETILCS